MSAEDIQEQMLIVDISDVSVHGVGVDNKSFGALSSIGGASRRHQPAQADANLSDDGNKMADAPKLSASLAKDIYMNDNGMSSGEDSPVLLIEQNAFSLIALQVIFGQFQVSVDQASNFDQGLQMIKDRLDRKGTSYKLVIFDSSIVMDSGIQEA